MCACLCACVRVCVRACVRLRACVCLFVFFRHQFLFCLFNNTSQPHLPPTLKASIYQFSPAPSVSALITVTPVGLASHLRRSLCWWPHSPFLTFPASLAVRSRKLQALVYDILPSTTAVFSYAIGSRKLSANEQFFVGAQIVVSLLQTTQIISDVCFITDHVAYASSNQTKIV